MTSCILPDPDIFAFDKRAGQAEAGRTGGAHRRAAPRVLVNRRLCHRLLAHAAYDVPLGNRIRMERRSSREVRVREHVRERFARAEQSG